MVIEKILTRGMLHCTDCSFQWRDPGVDDWTYSTCPRCEAERLRDVHGEVVELLKRGDTQAAVVRAQHESEG
jgi:hypothetical protein